MEEFAEVWAEVLANDEAVGEVKKRFESACAKFQEYERVVENPLFSPDEDLEKAMELFGVLSAMNPNSSEFRKLAREHNDEFKKVADRIVYNEALKDADVIYDEILRCAKHIYGNLEDFGFKKKELRVLVCEMGEIKEEIDALKDFNTDNADKEIYPQSVRVEPITEKKALYKYFRAKK